MKEPSDDGTVRGNAPRGGPSFASPEFPGFDVLGELGRGGMGVVYRAFDRRRCETVALKTLLQADPAALYRFKQEFRLVADIAHRNLVNLYELVSDGQTWFFTMELVSGVHLAEHLRAGGDLRDAFHQIATGVAAVHRSGRLHRDLKPSNVMVAHDGRVVILDYGLATELARRGDASTEQNLLGTVAYMSPEQARSDPLTAASDWYSLGVMLYEAIVGRLPFDGDPISILIEKQRHESLSPRAADPDAPEDLDELCRALTQQDPRRRPTEEEVLRRLEGWLVAASVATECEESAVPAVRLLGREREMAALEEAYRSLRAGEGSVVLVEGASGMGKTALVQAFLDRVAESGDAAVFAGRCYEHESVPYKAFDSPVDAIANYLKRLGRLEVEALLPRDVQPLVQVFPVLGRVEAVAQAPRLALDVTNAQEVRRRAFAALRELLGKIGDRHPLVLHVDDAQWGDVDSAVLLSDVLRPPHPPAALVLLSFRSEQSGRSPFLHTLRGVLATTAVRRVAVEALGVGDAAALARRGLGGDDPSTRATAEQIARESGGNPFFLQELVEHARSADGPSLPGGSRVGISLAEVLGARVRALPETCRTLLEVVAIAGGPIREIAACEASEVGSCRQALAMLRTGRLVRGSGAPEREEIDTYHDRVRETLLATLEPSQARRHHLHLAETVEASEEGDPEFLALHFEAAGEAARAARHCVAAAEKAEAALAFGHAAQLFRRALDLGVAQGEERRRLWLRLAASLAYARRNAEAAKAYGEAIAGSSYVEGLEIHGRVAEQLLLGGQIDAWVAEVEPVLAAMGMPLAKTPLRAILLYLARMRFLRIRGLGFREVAAADLPIDLRVRLDLAGSLSMGLGLVDNIRAAEFHSRQLLRALRAGEPERIVHALSLEISYSSRGGTRTHRRTEKVVRMAEELAARVPNPQALGFVRMCAGVGALLEGRFAATLDLLDQGERIIRERSVPGAWELNYIGFFSLRALVYLGRLQEMSRRLASWSADAEERGDLTLRTDLGVRIAPIVRLAHGDVAAARASVDEALARWTRGGFFVQHYYAMCTRVEIALYAGDGEAAWGELERAWEAYAHSLLGHVQFVAVSANFYRASCAVGAAEAGPRKEERLRDASRALRKMAKERTAYAAGWISLLRAGIEHLCGRPEAAIRLLESAEGELAAAQLALYAAAARRQRGRLTGGARGDALVGDADAAMSAEGIVDPGRFAAMYAPGFRDARAAPPTGDDRPTRAP